MGSLPQGSMVAVFAPLSIVREIIANHSTDTGVAAINGDNNIVISGNPQTITTIITDLTARGIATKRLNVSHAFQSPMMQPITAEFRRELDSVSYNLPNIPIIANLTGEISDTEIATAEYWCRHLQQPVRFADGMATLRKQGYEVFIECSPRSILMGMARSLDCDREIWLPSLRRDG
jgi:acyl transferase domain-containing protein